MNHIKIYTPEANSRLQYACHIIFEVILKQPFKIVSEKEEGIQICYCAESIKDIIQVVPSGLLEQKGVASHEIKLGEFEGVKTLFHSGEGDLPFDIFSAVFYMCSRYEEYLPFEPDEHGRFKAEDSLAYRIGCITDPIVELWTHILADRLEIPYSKDKLDLQLTIDVDQAWMYSQKSFPKSIGGFVRDILTFKFKEVKSRLNVLAGMQKDPWHSFDYLDALQEKLKLPIQYFFLLGQQRPFDTAISFKNKKFRRLIYTLQQKNKVGIHPSYESNFSYKTLEKEYYALSRIVKNKPTRSRQHYLKMQFPDSFRNIILLGVNEDFSLGWASKAGFRAGISQPFPFYDLLKEKQTHLIMTPFAFMERTLKDYMNLDAVEGLKEIKQLIDKTKAVGGHFSMLWHNDSVSDSGEWKGWRKVLEEAIDYSQQ